MTDVQNVFVLTTGRSGSTTFSMAASHATNFSAAHETRTHLTGAARFDYPARHIEIDNRLAWCLGRLDRAYGDRAHYVHLLRDSAAAAASFATRRNYGLMKAYRETILLNLDLRAPGTPILQMAEDLVDTVSENIRAFLQGKSHVMTLHMETMTEDFPRFWHWIGAAGDLAAAMAEWQTRNNATE